MLGAAGLRWGPPKVRFVVHGVVVRRHSSQRSWLSSLDHPATTTTTTTTITLPRRLLWLMLFLLLLCHNATLACGLKVLVLRLLDRRISFQPCRRWRIGKMCFIGGNRGTDLRQRF